MNLGRRIVRLWIPVFIVAIEIRMCQGNSLPLHLIRHHQIGGKPKKTSGDIRVNEIGNGTEDIGQNVAVTETASLPDLVVKPREEVTLHCYISHSILPSHLSLGLVWLHDGQAVDSVEMGVADTGHRYRRDPIKGHLHISNIRLEDDGLWQCQYHDLTLNDILSSKPLRLIVLVADAIPETILIRPKEIGALDLSAYRIRSGNPFATTRTMRTPSCESAGPFPPPGFMEAIDRPKNPYLVIDGRRLDPGNLFIPVKENTELSVTCIVEGGNPPPTIKWSLILSPSLDTSVFGEEINAPVDLNITENASNDVSNRVFVHAHTRSEVRLENVMRGHHNATVMCLAHHVTLPSALNASLLLDVQYSPSFAISREPGFGFPIREGIPVSLKCDVDSNPPSSPVWQKDDVSPPVAQSGDGFLNFSAIKREHSGWYKCTSHHLLGDFSSIGYFLNVRYDPVVEVTQNPSLETQSSGKQIEVALGGAVQLQCPENTLGCWSRVGAGGRLEAVGPGPGLALEDVLYQDAGEYRCVVGRKGSYDKWRSEINVDVTVKGRPVVYPANTSVTAYTGQRLDLSVEFCANPPPTNRFWITETQRLQPGQVTSEFIVHNITAGSSIHCLQAVLTLKHVRAGHEGEYIFLVRSPKGLAEGSITLNVTRLSGYYYSSGPKSAAEVTAFGVMLVGHFYARIV